MLALPRRQSLILPSGHANRPSRIQPGGRPSWRIAGGKALQHRSGAPTIVAEPMKRPTMLALPRRQSLILPSGHANRSPRIQPGGGPSWRLAPGKSLWHRPGEPTICGGAREAAGHVGGAPPAKPDSTVGPRQQAPVSIPVAAPIPCRIHPPFTSSLHLFDSEYYIAGVSFLYKRRENYVRSYRYWIKYDSAGGVRL